MWTISRVIIMIAAVATVADADSKVTEPSRDRIARMVGAIYEGDGLGELGELSDVVGARVTGSPGYAKAAEWAAGQMRAAGIQNVHFENFAMAHGWQRGSARARVVAPLARELHVESVGWTPSTPNGGLRAEVVVVRDLEPATLAAVALKGKLVVFDRTAPDGPPPGVKDWIALKRQVAALKAAGAVALMLTMRATNPNNVVQAGVVSSRGEISPLPIVTVGLEDSARIIRAADQHVVTITLDVSNVVSGPLQVPNVIGELPGDKPSQGWILIGAHLDSWDLATGSQDNGSGVVQVLQAARALAAAGSHERSIRFGLWGGEEQGMIGSHAYAEAHQAELASCVVVLNTDSGAGHVGGWRVEGRKDVRAAMLPLAETLLASLGGSALDLELNADTDHLPFLAAGVPTLDLLVDMTKYEAIHHKEADTIDKVDAHALASGSAVVAVTALALASTTIAFAPHLDRAAVTDLLKIEGYDELLRLQGWWK